MPAVESAAASRERWQNWACGSPSSAAIAKSSSERSAGLQNGRDRAVVATCDIADRCAVEAAVASVKAAFDTIDVLVCNAGTNVRNRSLEALDPGDWDRMIATNLTGSFNVLYYVLPMMRKQQNGLVIQICSISGMRASTLGGAGYSASKFGQAALGICVGREEGSRGIRSSVIYPGEVETPILDARPVPVAAERRAVDPAAGRHRRRGAVLGRAASAGARARTGDHADRR